MKRCLIVAMAILTASAAHAEEVAYEVEDEGFTGYFAEASSPKGLVLIVHDWEGVTGYEERRADMLAGMGYDAFAPGMFGDETPTDTVEHRQAATGALYEDRERMRRLMETGLAEARGLSDANGLVAMGDCFGGAVTLKMARSDMAGEAASMADSQPPEGQTWDGDEPPLLIAHGAAESSIATSDVAALTRELGTAGNTYMIEICSGAPHAFTTFGSARYQERADTGKWEAFQDFFSERPG